MALFATNLDGTDYAIFAGDEGARLKRMPCVTAHRLAVFVESEEADAGRSRAPGGRDACDAICTPIAS